MKEHSQHEYHKNISKEKLEEFRKLIKGHEKLLEAIGKL